ncbi:retrovirus-related pol polyprotein from transposon TNT 1-94 [Tanacetum coccineum]|uniref:Retrovirus-related pol polyprotein from transposon TNT 1-94 n=1 Tax=Tanacetum coccineum TaxID=301880 RepID=A0ABQ4YFF1_9ASTR
MKRHGKTSYDVFRGRSPDISYFDVFGCPIHIHNHKDHLGKFDEKADDGFFLGYSPVAKAFRVFNIRRQEMEEIVHVTFSEDDEAISQSSTEGDAIIFNENRSFLDDEFLKPRSKVTQCLSNTEYFPYISSYNNATPSDSPILYVSVASKDPPEFTEADNHRALTEVILQTYVPQDRWSREKHIELVNIIGEPLAGVTTRSKIKDSDVALASECLYVNFLSKMEPKKLIEALEKEGWIIAMKEELNQFEINKVWTLVPKPHGKTIIGTKWVWKNKMDENGIVIKNNARLAAQGYNQQERIDYEETFVPIIGLEAIRIFLAYAVYMGFMVYQMDVKSAFLNGKISEEVYVQQPLGFESSEFPNHVCKVDKALYRLKQAPRAWGLSDTWRKVSMLECKEAKLCTMSSAKAEYVAAAGCYAKVLWIKSQLAYYDVLYDKVPIFCDNTSAIAISNNPVLHSKTKHIDIRYHFIRYHILKGDIELHFVPTDLQLADIFTKPLAEPSFTRLVAEFGMLNIEKQVSDKKKALSDL